MKNSPEKFNYALPVIELVNTLIRHFTLKGFSAQSEKKSVVVKFLDFELSTRLPSKIRKIYVKPFSFPQK